MEYSVFGHQASEAEAKDVALKASEFLKCVLCSHSSCFADAKATMKAKDFADIFFKVYHITES